MSVVEAVRHDIAIITETRPELADSTWAATALALAAEIDNPSNSATSKSLCSKEIRDTLATLQSLCPPRAEKDEVDELSSRRDKRRSAASR